jgi:hypothetical protein
VLGVLAYSTAIYMLIALVIFCVAKLLRPKLPGPGSRPLLLGMIAAALLVLGLGLAFRNAPQAKPDFAFDLPKLVEFVLIYLGNALTTGPLRLLSGIVILAAGAASIWRLAAERRITEALLWVILFFFAPFNALMTGIGRLGYGVKIAATSRYQSVTAITLIATIVLVLAALPKSATGPMSQITRRNERKVVAEIAMRQGIEGNQHLKAVTPAFAQLKRSIPTLRAARHAPFHWRSRCEERLGQHFAAPPGPTAGRLDTISAYKMSRGGGRALELSGWAERDGVAAECILLADSTGTAIGAGTLVARRPDVEQAAARSLGLVGWKSVASVPASSHVCAYALFPGESEPVPLADCQAIPEGAAAP